MVRQSGDLVHERGADEGDFGGEHVFGEGGAGGVVAWYQCLMVDG